MSHLPLIVGFGGVNPAGRSSFHHAYRRLILDHLDAKSKQETLLSLATLMGLAHYESGSYTNADGDVQPLETLLDTLLQQILDHTLIRRIEPASFDVDQVMFNKAATLKNDGEIHFVLKNVNCLSIFLLTGH